jgi:hypothetical protein
MAQLNTNPDRDFSADYRPEGEDLRDLLKRREVADYSDSLVQERTGRLIGRAAFDSRKQWW